MRQQFKIQVGELTAAIGAWCPNEIDSEAGWSLAKLQNQASVNEHPVLVGCVRSALRTMGVHKAYAPNVGMFSAKVVEKTALEKAIRLGKNAMLYRDRAVPADGVFIPKGRAFVMGATVCPLIIATGGGNMITSYAGHDSLSTSNLSVVHAILKAFREHGVSAKHVSMCMVLSVRSLENAFVRQAIMLGVPNVRSAHSLAEYPALARTHGEKRSLVIAKHCPA